MYELVELTVGDRIAYDPNPMIVGEILELLGDNMALVKSFSPCATRNIVVNLKYYHRAR